MQYSVRNTIILAVLLLIVIIGFAINNTKQKKVRDNYRLQYDNLATELDNLKRRNPDYNDYDRIVMEYEMLERKARATSKIIPPDNNPSLSYLYMLTLAERYCPDVDFNFTLTEMNNSEEEIVQYNIYNLRGTAPINSLYSFLYQIENQALFYTIEALRITEGERIDEFGMLLNTNTVNFDMSVKALYDVNSTETTDFIFRNLEYSNLTYNPFLSRVYEPIVDVSEEQYPNLATTYLIGLTPERVFLRGSNESITILSIGDRVAYGYLDRIDWEEQSAVFKINQTGVTVEKILYLDRN
ncbi:MAG: hypothetical protein JW996_01455 [Candidatus Cloacimonetes bacterium]|nr:hypothetical protein [Candidatus Cloacimonadota bacterium]